MTDSNRRSLPSVAQLRTLLPVLAVALLLAAAWLGWAGWQKARDAGRAQALEQSRDLAAQSTGRALGQQEQQLEARLASPELQALLGAGNLEGAAAVLGADWPQLDAARILPPDLAANYAGLEDGGVGRLAVLEAALAADGATARVIRDDGIRLALAAPARVDGRTIGIAYLLLPVSVATGALESINVADDSYLALRQGSYTILERGDTSLSGTAEAMSVAIGDSSLRLSASLPDESAGAFGLGSTASFIGAGLLLLLAAAAGVLARRGPGDDAAVEAGAEERPRTLQEALAETGPGDAVDSADATEADAVVAATTGSGAGTEGGPGGGAEASPAEASAVRGAVVDPGIFRAYDVRGVVGKTLSPRVARLLGQAIGTVMHEQGATDIVVGRDGRLSGPDMVAALAEGLRKAGR